MTAIKKILFATDFSDVSKNAREQALFLKDKLGCHLEIIHVFDPNSFEMPAPYYMMPGVEKWLDEHFQTLRNRGKAALEDLCPVSSDIKGHFLEGKPGKTIVTFADENDFDIIVMGTHGHTGWNRLVLGSVAEFVVRHAQASVLTVKPTEENRKE